MNDIINKLNSKFISRYAKTFAMLNLNINKVPIEHNKYYEVPVVTLGEGGATIVTGSPDVIQLAPAARVTVEYKKVLPMQVIYRISIPEDEGVKASEDQSYFNYIFDPVVNSAIAGYKKAFGDENEIRFGDVYCSPNRPGPEENSIFKLHDSISSDHSGFELRLHGNWASDKLFTGSMND